MSSTERSETSKDMKDTVCEKLLNAIRFSYDNRDKLIILTAGVTIFYYSVASLKATLDLYDQIKWKYKESCQNLEYITDYLSGIKFRCEHCGKKYRKRKCFTKHCYIHEFEEMMPF